MTTNGDDRERRTLSSSREEILGNVRQALGRRDGAPAPAPSLVRPDARPAGHVDLESACLLEEIVKLGGQGRHLTGKAAVAEALADLIAAEGIGKATLWDTPDLKELDIAGVLLQHQVTIVSSSADPSELAECDLGITGADAALPETGSLLLRSGSERPRLTSLLPRVHLAIIRPGALRADLHQALAGVKGEGYAVLVTGPSRTADIELTLTIGVHGPKALHAWLVI